GFLQIGDELVDLVERSLGAIEPRMCLLRGSVAARLEPFHLVEQLCGLVVETGMELSDRLRQAGEVTRHGILSFSSFDSQSLALAREAGYSDPKIRSEPVHTDQTSSSTPLTVRWRFVSGCGTTLPSTAEMNATGVPFGSVPRSTAPWIEASRGV